MFDEAHRLNEKSGMFQNLGENQVKEIINAARTSIFFVDDFQIVTIKDIGSTNEIKKWCKFFDAEVYEDTLISQFRCNGSDSYLSWIDNVLEINPEATDDFDFDYDIRICDSPEEVKELILEKIKLTINQEWLQDIAGIGSKKEKIIVIFMISKLATSVCHGI